eukprot:GFYU01011598.1.p1 GENE.GFYU01011598.1~~GFYU01011598.1.p1  ORF type:complete len:322 (-),score=33.59 GFYU01011598.1:63-1028(-)
MPGKPQKEFAQLILQGNLTQVRARVEADKSLVHTADDGDSRPVHYAAASPSLPILQYLVEEQGAKLDVVDREGNTPLHTAVEYGLSEKVVVWLLQHGCPANEQNKYGQTALAVAIQVSSLHMVKALRRGSKLEENTDNMVDVEKVADWAKPVAKCLTRLGAPPKRSMLTLATPMGLAFLNREYKIWLYLLDVWGANINAPLSDRFGYRTCMHVCCTKPRRTRRRKWLFALIDRRANPYAEDSSNLTAFEKLPLQGGVYDAMNAYRSQLRGDMNPTQIVPQDRLRDIEQKRDKKRGQNENAPVSDSAMDSADDKDIEVDVRE